jgi:hypothetical protein
LLSIEAAVAAAAKSYFGQHPIAGHDLSISNIIDIPQNGKIVFTLTSVNK